MIYSIDNINALIRFLEKEINNKINSGVDRNDIYMYVEVKEIKESISGYLEYDKCQD